MLGNFRDLLGATAKSPAMLFYLDNWLNVAESRQERKRCHEARSADCRGPRRRARRAEGAESPTDGLNENYARELMELHTLGVDGGYTQADIVNVARAFTGWTIQPRQGSGFQFASGARTTTARR